MTAARPVGCRDQLFGAALAAAYVALLMATAGDLGMSRDESFYVVAAERYASWFEALTQDPTHALERETIDRAWEYNHEHPALMKSLFALSHLAHARYDLFSSPSLAHRFPGMLSAGLLLWLIYIFGARALGRPQGAFAALLFATLPRPFYHAHLNGFDIPIVLMVTWVIYAYWRTFTAQRGSRWIWTAWTGIAFGCALATKHNSWILPGILVIHFAWARWNHANASEMPRWPWALVAMAILGPALFVGSWPWLWHDTWSRFLWYARFHMQHDYYNIAYFGLNHFHPPFPWSYPWVMTAITWPVTSLLLALAGWFVCVPALWPARLQRPAWLPTHRLPSRWLPSDPRQTAVLWTGALVAPILLISLPSTPIFGGTKHWFTAYPFMALFAGQAFVLVCQALQSRLPHLRQARVVSLAAGAWLLAPAGIEAAHSHPFGLSHYGFLIGGVPGAADAGMNRQFWGFTTGTLAPYLREALPRGGKVWLCDTTFMAFRMLQRDGHIPNNIQPAADIARADLALVHHEHHFAEVDYQIWMAYGTLRPIHVLTYDGVPIVSVYRHPQRKRR